MSRKHIVHFSGYSLGAHPALSAVTRTGEEKINKPRDWRLVCVGDRATGALGRIPTTLLHAYSLGPGRPDHIMWSTGATRLVTGESEARISFEYALEHFASYRRDFPLRFTDGAWFPDLPQSRGAFVSWLENLSVFDEESINTLTSMEFIARFIDDYYPDTPVQVDLISSGNHASRVRRDATIVIKREPDGRSVRRPLVTISVIDADTDYGGKTVADVIIHELGEQKK